MTVPKQGRAWSVGRGAERTLVVLASLAVAIGVIALLSGGLLAGRDSPGISGAGAGPGTSFPDQGHARLSPGQLQPVYNSDPPTSGPHIPEPIVRDRAQLSDYQLLQGLEVGDVILMYGTRRPPAGLSAMAAAVAPPFTPALAAAGGAVVLAHRPGTRGVVALAWTRMLRVASARDPALRGFAQFWLGRGDPHAG
ncbi:MAG: DUF3105 domain-containing protein [Solirubrobacteraceae bacterium]